MVASSLPGDGVTTAGSVDVAVRLRGLLSSHEGDRVRVMLENLGIKRLSPPADPSSLPATPVAGGAVIESPGEEET